MHEESLYNSGCDSWIKQQAWHFFLSMFFVYMFICVVYLHVYEWAGKCVREHACICVHVHWEGWIVICASLNGTPPYVLIHISHLTVELAIWDILARQLLQGLSFLYVLRLQLATGPVKSYAGAWDLNSGSHSLPTNTFSQSLEWIISKKC